MMRAGPPWCDSLKAKQESILAARRALRASSDPPQSWPSLAEFYAGRAVLLTGGSGFMGRVLVEFLLRCCPDIGSVYLILRARKGVSPEQRLRQLTDVPLFDRLRREQPDALSKVVVLPGDVALPGLGLSAEHRSVLARSVSVVFHCAASVRFDDPFRKAVFTNLRSTRDIIQLAREMPLLKVLVHVSTAYAFTNQPVIGERVYPTHLDWRDVIRWAEGLSDADAERVDWLDHKLRDFQPNTYTFTKALAERLVGDEAGDLPVVITRPSIVIGSRYDPLPGWMDNLNGPAGLWAAAYKGILRAYPLGDAVMDTIPVDFATRIMLLASWKKGIGKPIRVDKGLSDGIDVVNVTVGTDLGPNIEEYVHMLSDSLLKKSAFPGAVRYPEITYFSSINDFRYKVMNLYSHILFGAVLDLLARLAGVKPRALKIYRTITTALQAVSPFTHIAFAFEMNGQENLVLSIHPADEKNVDLVSMYSVRDTMEEFENLCTNTMRGILKYALRENDDHQKNYAHYRKVYWYEFIYHFFMMAIFGGLVYVAFLISNLSKNKY